MASDKLSSIQEPILNLDLDVQSEAVTQIHSLELTREDLNKLISSLDSANRVCQLLEIGKYSNRVKSQKPIFGPEIFIYGIIHLRPKMGLANVCITCLHV